MTLTEARMILGEAVDVLCGMGLIGAAVDAERAQMMLYEIARPERALEYADLVLPPGYRGRVKLTLHGREHARALAFIAGVLRSIEGP